MERISKLMGRVLQALLPLAAVLVTDQAAQADSFDSCDTLSTTSPVGTQCYIGTAPFCNASQSSCTNHSVGGIMPGLTFVRYCGSDTSDSCGSSCWSGEKVICAVPQADNSSFDSLVDPVLPFLQSAHASTGRDILGFLTLWQSAAGAPLVQYADTPW